MRLYALRVPKGGRPLGAESALNSIASHVNFGDDSALNALTRIQWTAALSRYD